MGTILDLTQQKQAEEALCCAKEEAEEFNRQKSEFVNMMSHELRTPMTVILGYIPLLKQPEALLDPSLVGQIAADMETSGTN